MRKLVCTGELQVGLLRQESPALHACHKPESRPVSNSMVVAQTLFGSCRACRCCLGNAAMQSMWPTWQLLLYPVCGNMVHNSWCIS